MFLTEVKVMLPYFIPNFYQDFDYMLNTGYDRDMTCDQSLWQWPLPRDLPLPPSLRLDLR